MTVKCVCGMIRRLRPTGTAGDRRIVQASPRPRRRSRRCASASWIASLATPAFNSNILMRLDAAAATVDRGNRERPQLEIELLDTGIGDDVHAQPRRHRLEVRMLRQVGEAVIDVVHRHDRGSRPRGGLRLIGQMLRCRRIGGADDVGDCATAIAVASTVPHSCCGVRRGNAVEMPPRLSRRSLAKVPAGGISGHRKTWGTILISLVS